MQKWFTRFFVLALVFCMAAGQSAAFDLKFGRLDFGPPPAHATAPARVSDDALGAVVTIAFGDSGSGNASATLNGVDTNRFTGQNAKDAFISTMLIGAFVVAGALSVSALANGISSH